VKARIFGGSKQVSSVTVLIDYASCIFEEMLTWSTH